MQSAPLPKPDDDHPVRCCDGRVAKLGVLFGFKNGGPGKHGLTCGHGRRIFVQSREQKPTLITEADGRDLPEMNQQPSGQLPHRNPGQRPCLLRQMCLIGVSAGGGHLGERSCSPGQGDRPGEPKDSPEQLGCVSEGHQ
jgi:hypothetical protein